jgi:hypothetical protein
MRRVVGIDFDNTLVSYDAIIHRAAIDRGLIGADTDVVKRTVRDRIRLGPGGEIEWQKLQALVYGPLMPQARLIDGVSDFVRACRAGGVAIHVVSHKTEYAGCDATGTNLRTAAFEWMTAHRFFDAGGLALGRGDVYFEGTREAKIARIASLGCTHFVDDLEEVFREPSFPAGVERLLYAPDAAAPAVSGDVRVMPSWTAIGDYLFGARA